MTARSSPARFAAVLFKNIGSLMSGSLSVVLAAIGFWLDSKFARSAFFSFAGFCAIVAAYRVWSDERTARLRAEAYLASPDLHILVHRCFRWTGGGGPFLLIEATVTNHSVGTATVKGFDCVLTFNGTAIKDGGWTTVDPTSRFRIRDAVTNHESLMNQVTLDLATQLSEHPLPRGEHIRGYLEFYFSKLPAQNSGVELELRFTDALGGVHQEKSSVPFVADGWFGTQISQESKVQS